MAYELSLIDRLRGIHSALDDAIGDSDVTHIEDDEEMRDRYPVQWAAENLAAVICELLPPEEDPRERAMSAGYAVTNGERT